MKYQIKFTFNAGADKFNQGELIVWASDADYALSSCRNILDVCGASVLSVVPVNLSEGGWLYGVDDYYPIGHNGTKEV